MSKCHQIMDVTDIDRALMRMTHEILEKHRGTQNLALIGIQTRGVFLARRLRNKIQTIEKADIPAAEIDITLYRDDWTRVNPNPLVQTTRIGFPIDGKQIILVDDVLFTGRTIRSAMDALIDFGRPDRIELAVLIDRGHRELPIQADYVGKVVKTRRSEMVNVLLFESDGTEKVVIESLS